MTIEVEGLPLHVEGPETADKGIIVIQEWWGLNNQIKKTTKKMAELLGGIAVSPDLYRGKVAVTGDEAGHLMKGLNWEQAMNDLRIAAQFLKKRGVKKVGVTGFCMGGALALAASVHCAKDIHSGVCFYGIPPHEFADPKKSSIPMAYHFGNLDPAKGFSDKAAADQLKETLKAAGKDVSEFYQYESASHAFMNEEAPAYPYNKEAAELAMQRTIDFFKRTLN